MESGCRLFHSVPFDLGDMLLAEGDGASGFFWLHLLLLLLRRRFILLFTPRLSGFASELRSITPFFHTLMFLFPPAFLYVTPPFPPMHLGNQEMESDAEDEVNRTRPTPSCSAPIILALYFLL